MRADDGTCTEEETENREDTEDMHTAEFSSSLQHKGNRKGVGKDETTKK
jgi:hypothetical protein